MIYTIFESREVSPIDSEGRNTWEQDIPPDQKEEGDSLGGTGRRGCKIGRVIRGSLFLDNPEPFEQLSIIPPVKDLEVHRRIQLPELPDLPILLGHQVLLQGG